MPDRISTLTTSRWRKLRLLVIATLFDLAEYSVLALGVIAFHLVGIAMLAVGVDQRFLEGVHWMETAAHVSVLGGFFWRVSLRAVREAAHE